MESGLSPAELMFGRRVRSIYDKLLLGRKINVWKNTKQMSNRYFKSGDKIFIRLYISVEKMWKDGVIISRLGKTTYMIQSQNWRHKRHVNKLKYRFTKEENVQTHLPMEILCDTFNLPTPQVINPQRKRNLKELLDMDPKRRERGGYCIGLPTSPMDHKRMVASILLISC